MENNNILSDDELEMLQSLFNSKKYSSIEAVHGLILHDLKLLSLLHKASNLSLEATIKHHHIRFAVDIINDEEQGFVTPRLSVPEIYEEKIPDQRLWRLDHPENLILLNKDGEPLSFDIKNISSNGLLIQESKKTLELGAPFIGILSGSHVQIDLKGVVVRNKIKKNRWQEWAVRLTLPPDACSTLQKYIFQQHQKKYYLHDERYEDGL